MCKMISPIKSNHCHSQHDCPFYPPQEFFFSPQPRVKFHSSPPYLLCRELCAPQRLSGSAPKYIDPNRQPFDDLNQPPTGCSRGSGKKQSLCHFFSLFGKHRKHQLPPFQGHKASDPYTKNSMPPPLVGRIMLLVGK